MPPKCVPEKSLFFLASATKMACWIKDVHGLFFGQYFRSTFEPWVGKLGVGDILYLQDPNVSLTKNPPKNGKSDMFREGVEGITSQVLAMQLDIKTGFEQTLTLIVCVRPSIPTDNGENGMKNSESTGSLDHFFMPWPGCSTLLRNPAVTVAVFLRGKCSRSKAACYVGVQFLGRET